MNRHDDELRTRVARGWAESGLSQDSYAKLHGIRARTLRSWLVKYVPPRQPPGEQVRADIVKAIEKLQAVLEAIDRAAAVAQQGDEQRRTGEGEYLQDEVEAHATATVEVVPKLGAVELRRADDAGVARGHTSVPPAVRSFPPVTQPVKLAPPRRVRATASYFSDL